MGSQPPPLLSLRKIGKTYGERLIVRNLDLDIHQAEGILLTGANGAGKTTLIRIMAGLSAPTVGTIQRAPELRLAYLGHATFIYGALSAIENLAFWARIHKLPQNRQSLLATLRRVGLHKSADRAAGTFSRGMAQRLNLARVLLARPQLYLLDEPFTGMDSSSREMVLSLLLAERGNGAAVVIVTHSPEADASLADKTLLLADGNVSAGKMDSPACLPRQQARER